MAQVSQAETLQDKITVNYWPVNFRGHFSKLVLTFAGVPFKEEQNFQKLKKICKGPIQERPFPAFAVPIIQVDFADQSKGTFYISQMAAGVQYLARKYGMEPQNTEDASHALMILMNCNDVLVEITRNNGNQMWTFEAWMKWRNGRLLDWFNVFELLLQRNEDNIKASKTVCFFGKDVCYADLAVFHILNRFIDFLYPNNNDWIKTGFPLCWQLHEQIASVESVKKFLKDHEGRPFCGGQIGESIAKSIKAELAQQNPESK